MVTKVLTETTFIHGRLAYAGETVDLDANDPSGYAPAASTPIGSLTVDQLRAALARAENKEDPEPRFSSNVADPSDAPVGNLAMPIADIAPRSPGGTAPQGLPPGGYQTVGGKFVFPTAAGDPNPTQVAVAPTPEGLALADASLPQLDHDGDGQPGGSLKKAEIVQALKDRGDEVDESKTKAELAEQLATPPSV